ncbi:hypothetical protein Dimus_036527 [Dionaea muscipula]
MLTMVESTFCNGYQLQLQVFMNGRRWYKKHKQTYSLLMSLRSPSKVVNNEDKANMVMDSFEEKVQLAAAAFMVATC